MRPRALLAFKRAATRVGLPQRSARLRLTMLYGALFLIAGAGLLAITYGLIAVTGESDVSNVQHGSPGAAGAPTGDDGPPVAPQILGLAEEHQSLGRLLLLSSLALMIMAVISMGLGWLMAGRVLRPLRTMTTRARQISELNLHERLAVAGPDDELKELGAGFLSSSRPVPPGEAGGESHPQTPDLGGSHRRNRRNSAPIVARPGYACWLMPDRAVSLLIPMSLRRSWRSWSPWY